MILLKLAGSVTLSLSAHWLNSLGSHTEITTVKINENSAISLKSLRRQLKKIGLELWPIEVVSSVETYT